jgi:hypothetical protein
VTPSEAGRARGTWRILGPKYLDINTDAKGLKAMALLIMITGFLSIGYYQLLRLRRH